MKKTLRDEIAIAAMQGLIQNPVAWVNVVSDNQDIPNHDAAAEWCYDIATAMLEARKEKDNA